MYTNQFYVEYKRYFGSSPNLGDHIEICRLCLKLCCTFFPREAENLLGLPRIEVVLKRYFLSCELECVFQTVTSICSSSYGECACGQ